VKDAYLEMISLVERLHRQCLEVVKADLDRRGIRDLNNVQALILFNIGEEEFSVGELTQRGYYLGSNVSYNVKKMVENELENNRFDKESLDAANATLSRLQQFWSAPQHSGTRIISAA